VKLCKHVEKKCDLKLSGKLNIGGKTKNKKNLPDYCLTHNSYTRNSLQDHCLSGEKQ